MQIAYYDEVSKEIKLTFDRDDFEKMLSPVMDSLLGKDFVYEYISVVDDDVFGEKGDPALQISFFNIEEGASYNLFWFDITKKYGEGRAISYYLKALPGSNGNSCIDDWTFITCKGTDCNNGCKKIGKDCSACPDPANPNVKPHCEKTEKQVLEVIITPMATIIGALLGLIK